MKIKYTKNALARTIALSLLTASYSGATFAIDYYLCAKQGSVTMSDGTVVPMWGFAQDTTGFANGCLDQIKVPGPALAVPGIDSTLNIHVRNVDLSEPVSVVIPGQNSTTMVPVMRPGVVPPRVQSFTHETAVGADGTYTWTNVKPGTFAYQSGTHPAVQIQMGLYGAMTKNQVDAAGVSPAEAYGTSTAYGSELTVFYSEIDTVLHNQVADGTYGTAAGMTSTMEYNPQYFLANGDDSSTGALDAGAPGATTLIRFINMGLKTHIPTVQGEDFAVIAEDGYAYQNARNQYSLLLAAGQTKDVLFTPPPLDTNPVTPIPIYVMFDRMLNLTNGSSGSGIVTAAVGGSGSALTSPGSLVTVLGTNADVDTVLDYRDNCLLVTNPNQRDTNGDGFGNICDADLNNDGQVNLSDFSLFRSAFGKTSPDADFNGDGQVNLSDYSAFRSMFGSEPGPSGIAN